MLKKPEPKQRSKRPLVTKTHCPQYIRRKIRKVLVKFKNDLLMQTRVGSNSLQHDHPTQTDKKEKEKTSQTQGKRSLE